MDLRVVEQVPIIAPPQKHRERYLATKRDKLGHLLPLMNEQAPAQPTEGD
jgi:3,4-dihydroxy 2-butanone 4-phosphate synthase/GTP cyclohydrolase II